MQQWHALHHPHFYILVKRNVPGFSYFSKKMSKSFAISWAFLPWALLIPVSSWRRYLLMTLDLCPLCFPAQPFDIVAISLDGVFEGFVFLLLACESFALPFSWPVVFSHQGCLAFLGANPSCQWSCRRHCPMGQPSSNLFSKPLVAGTSQSWCSPADLCSCCLSLSLLTVFWLHLWL